MTAQLFTHFYRCFNTNLFANFEIFKGRQFQSFFHDLEGQCCTVDLHDRQTDTAHRHAITDLWMVDKIPNLNFDDTKSLAIFDRDDRSQTFDKAGEHIYLIISAYSSLSVVPGA
ncbi:MAG: hypothetical protein JW384_01833 [Nitrosomonadaceae bacterium]|nr:hypothetical protein [Nitrosomonadaceae bacterium]